MKESYNTNMLFKLSGFLNYNSFRIFICSIKICIFVNNMYSLKRGFSPLFFISGLKRFNFYWLYKQFGLRYKIFYSPHKTSIVIYSK